MKGGGGQRKRGKKRNSARDEETERASEPKEGERGGAGSAVWPRPAVGERAEGEKSAWRYVLEDVQRVWGGGRRKASKSSEGSARSVGRSELDGVEEAFTTGDADPFLHGAT